MAKEFNVTKDKKGKIKVAYSYDMDEETLLKRREHLAKAINVYDYQIQGLTEAKEISQKELDAINTLLDKNEGGVS